MYKTCFHTFVCESISFTLRIQVTVLRQTPFHKKNNEFDCVQDVLGHCSALFMLTGNGLDYICSDIYIMRIMYVILHTRIIML